jgi:hypothetical protein
MPSNFNEALEWLHRAEQAREVAGQLTDPSARKAVLELAESFDRLGQAHRYAGDVSGPHLVRLVDRRATQKVRVDLVLGMPLAGVPLRPDRPQPEFSASAAGRVGGQLKPPPATASPSSVSMTVLRQKAFPDKISPRQ